MFNNLMPMKAISIVKIMMAAMGAEAKAKGLIFMSHKELMLIIKETRMGNGRHQPHGLCHDHQWHDSSKCKTACRSKVGFLRELGDIIIAGLVRGSRGTLTKFMMTHLLFKTSVL